MHCSRRELLKLGVGAAALWTAGVGMPPLFAASVKKNVPLGLQLGSLGTIATDDLPSTLDAVAAMGFQGVEFAGYYGRKADELRKILDQSGLTCCGTHTELDSLCGDTLKNTVEFSQKLGNKYLIVPSLPKANRASVAALIDTAKMLTKLAEELNDAGMRVGFHAHAQDFTPLADRIPWEVIFANAGPNVVMQLDTANCLQGGADPIALLKKFPHCSATIHLKEHGGPEGAVIGEGDVPWKELFELCETTADTEWYIVEQESHRGSPLESVKLSLQNLRNMRK